jgi:hypothetical protein
MRCKLDNMETMEQRYERFLTQNKGFWFASCLDMEQWAERKVAEGVLKPLSDLIKGRSNTKYWYILARITKTEELLEYFSYEALNGFGIYEHNLR